MSVSSLSAKSSLDSLRSHSSAQSAPDVLAPTVTGDMVWEGAELKDYVNQLTNAEVEEIEAAVHHFKCRQSRRQHRC